MSNRDAWQLARDAVHRDDAVILVTIADVRGSAPREVGASLVVTEAASAGSVGGGRLEWEATEQAHAMLRSRSAWRLDTVVLNADIGQCCGGKVQLLYERLDATDQDWLQCLEDNGFRGSLTSECSTGVRQRRWQPTSQSTTLLTDTQTLTLTHTAEAGTADVLLFGAGHIGRALAPLLATLPLRVHHIDTRDDVGSDTVEIVDPPEQVLRDAPADCLVLIMTHDHALDYRLAEAALAHPGVRWVGLVGSRAKRQQLSRRLRRSLGPERAALALTRLSCPIGQRINSRSPGEMATVIAAELLYARDNRYATEQKPARAHLA